MPSCWGYLHVATCSGPARTAERALPCGCRVRVVHASLHGSSFPSTSKARLSRLCLTRWSHVMLPWGLLRWHDVIFRRCGLSQSADTLVKFAAHGLTRSLLLVAF